MKKFVFLLMLVILTSCGVNMGTRIDNGNLQVFFLEGIEKEKAIEFSKYWINQGFVGTEKQYIQLEADKEVILVKLIEKEIYQEDLLTITEEAILQDIERDLKKNVFKQETEIVITDNTFRPIEKR